MLCDTLRASGRLVSVVTTADAERASSGERASSSSVRRLEKHHMQLLIQVSGAMRNLCVDKARQPELEAADAATALCAVLRPFASHSELMFNVARVLAKLSLYESMRASLNVDPCHVQDLLHVMAMAQPRLSSDPSKPPSKEVLGLIVRLAFTLGNLTASNDRNRELIGLEFGGVQLLVSMLQGIGSSYLAPVAAESSSGGKKKKTCAVPLDIEEVLVKLIRLVANISINADVGTQVVATEGVQMLISLLGHSVRMNREELLLNAVSAITNLSYYVMHRSAPLTSRHSRNLTGEAKDRIAGETQGGSDAEADPPSFIFAGYREICNDLVGVLIHQNDEAVAEAARAFGNFSRDAQVRHYMRASRGDEALVLLLDHASREVVFSASGALVNIAADSANKSVLLKDDLQGHAKLVSVLRRAGISDAEMAAVACKALHNLLLDAHVGGAESVLGTRTFRLLQRTLDELLDAAADAAADAAEAKGEDEPSAADVDFLAAARALQSIVLEEEGVSAYEDLDHR